MVSQGNTIQATSEQQQLSSKHTQTQGTSLNILDYLFLGIPSFAQSAPMNQMAISGPLPPPPSYPIIHPQMAMMLHQKHQMYLQQKQHQMQCKQCLQWIDT